MGRASTQPDASRKTGTGDSETGKEKKSKSKKSRRDKTVADPVADRAALEEESARALMLLSNSALHDDTRAPYYNLEDNMPPSTQAVPSDARAKAAEQTHGDDMQGTPPKKRKKKGMTEKRKDSGNKHGRKLKHRQPSIPPVEESATAVPTHPLDQEPSDDELMQEYETGVSRDQSTQTHSLSEQPPANLETNSGQDVTRPAHQNLSNAQISPNGQNRKRNERSSKKRKRRIAEPTAEDTQSHEMPIDPDLHSINVLPPLTYPDPFDEPNGNSVPELRSGNYSKRRRMEPKQNNALEGTEHEKCSSMDDDQGDDGEQIIRGLEDGRNELSMDFGSLNTEDTGVDRSRRQANPMKGRDKKSDKAVPGGKGGFTADEITKLDKYRDHYCAVNDLPVPGFNHLVQSNVRSNEFVNNIFNEIQDLFPYRTRSSVQRFCRRRFHNFHARGVWTPEEDADLKAAVALKGTSWKAIGELLGRFNEDCRDRYRNYLAPSAEHRNRDAWTETEVINLSHSVLDCMRLMKQERQRAKEERAGHDVPLSDSDSDQEAEDLKLINWQTVSDMMGRRGTARSRIQCSFKWSKIKIADRDRYLKEIKRAQNNLRGLERGKYSANNMKRSTGWRLKAASKQVMNMKSGDKYDLLNAILDSAAPEEENIPWRLIGDEAFRQKWSFSERKAGWLAMRKQVEGSEHMGYREVAQRLLTDLLAHGVDQRWNPAVDGFVDGSPVKRPRQPKPKSQTLREGEKRSKKSRSDSEPQREGAKSNGLTSDCDEDGEHVEAAPIPNVGEGADHDRGSQSPSSLFDGGKSPMYESMPGSEIDQSAVEADQPVHGEVSPELAGRIHMLQAA